MADGVTGAVGHAVFSGLTRSLQSLQPRRRRADAALCRKAFSVVKESALTRRFVATRERSSSLARVLLNFRDG